MPDEPIMKSNIEKTVNEIVSVCDHYRAGMITAQQLKQYIAVSIELEIALAKAEILKELSC